nr:hypothetical protein Iba_chr14bCG7210 [Ipomoea batatas]
MGRKCNQQPNSPFSILVNLSLDRSPTTQHGSVICEAEHFGGSGAAWRRGPPRHLSPFGEQPRRPSLFLRHQAEQRNRVAVRWSPSLPEQLVAAATTFTLGRSLLLVAATAVSPAELIAATFDDSVVSQRC